MNLVAHVVEGENRLVEHHRRVVHPEIVRSGSRDVFDQADHVVAEEANATARKRGQTGEGHRLKPTHRFTHLAEEALSIGCAEASVFGVVVGFFRSFADTADKERIPAQKGISRQFFSPFHRFQQKGETAAFLKLEKSRDRRQKIGDYRFVYRDDVARRTQLLNFFQTWTHDVSLARR